MRYEDAIKDPYVNTILDNGLRGISSFLTSEELESDKNYILCQAISSFNPQRSKFTTWLTNLTRFFSMDRYKSLKKNKSLTLTGDIEGPNFERSMKIKNVLSELNSLERDLLYSKYIEGYTNKELCDRFNLQKTELFPLLREARRNFKERYD